MKANRFKGGRRAPARLLFPFGLVALLGLCMTGQPQPNTDANGIEFYETKIRPVLAENCYPCHGPQFQTSELRLDHLADILKGGSRGPAIVPHDPDKSRLIQAVRYMGELRMPPKSRLKEAQIADLVAWIKMGAPAPQDTTEPPMSRPQPVFDLAERRKHWAYQSVKPVSVPIVKENTWIRTPIDHFVLAKLEAAGLSPAPPADKRTWLRRVTFDLIGLPPTPSEVEAFLADPAPDADQKVVDRLLASPHYGERWARHWLDLVRYAETLGHEYDYDLFNAWRYRDYVMRAFNSDVPYDRFVLEHLSGDLLPDPRRHPTEGFNESIIGTGFFWLGEGKHSPVDVRQEQADRIDNQIDVLGKAFLAQTIACARCHDHKFDALPTKDYYALAGYLKSSRYQQAYLDGPDRIAAPAQLLAVLKQSIQTPALLVWAEAAGPIGKYLLATRALPGGGPQDTTAVDQVAQQFGLDAQRLARWRVALQAPQVSQPQHPLYAWAQLSELPAAELAVKQKHLCGGPAQGAPTSGRAVLFEDFEKPTYDGWSVTGDAFGAGPSREGDIVLGDSPDRPVARFVEGGWAHSGRLTGRLEGELRSRTFTLEKRYIHLRVAGCGGRVNLVLDGFPIIRDPIYGRLTVDVHSEHPVWRRIDVAMWQGHRAYFELIDSTTPTLSQAPPEPNGWLAVDEIWFSDDSLPPPVRNPLSVALLQEPLPSIEALAERYQNVAMRFQSGALMNWLLQNQLLDAPPAVPAELWDEYRRIEADIPAPLRAPAMIDGTGEDEVVFLRGNYKNPGELAPRRLPEVVAGAEQPAPEGGSGRLELAHRLVAPSNPLFARVIANRIWKYHFGAGIVRTPDDFGHMGEPPTHPELLDWLASEFMRCGQSFKQMHRLMVLSSAYRMASQPRPEAERVDPQNRLLHHMPIRRLEAEAIRDAMLLVSGRLDRTMFGPSVLPHLTEFMEGRGRPAPGPLDGAGRRSIYLAVRRNFLNPMFLAFDYPIPFTTIGRRGVSNVPAQALMLLNDSFVVEQARRWAERVLADPGRTPAERVAGLYLAAFARHPSPDELRDGLAFIEAQRRRYASAADDPRVWTDLCHVLMNVKEFIFIP